MPVSRRIPWRPVAAGLLAIAAGIAVILVSRNPGLWTGLLDRIRGLGPWGPAAIVLAYIPACLLFVPGSPLSAGAGYLFGLVPGVVAVSLGSTAGASAAFWAGRTFARRWVQGRLAGSPRFEKLDAAVADSGFLIVLLTRLSPALPFNLLNYAFGLTRVRFRDYLLASWIGMLPGTVLYVYLGTTAASLSELLAGRRTRTAAEWALLATGLVATLAITVVLTRLARRALSKRLETGAAGEQTRAAGS